MEKHKDYINIANDDIIDLNNHTSNYHIGKISEMELSLNDIYNIHLKNKSLNERENILMPIIESIRIENREETDNKTIFLLLKLIYDNENFLNIHTFEQFTSLLKIENIIDIYNNKISSDYNTSFDIKYFQYLNIPTNNKKPINKQDILTDKNICSKHHHIQNFILSIFNLNSLSNELYFKQRTYEELVTGENSEILSIILNVLNTDRPKLDLTEKVELQEIIDNLPEKKEFFLTLHNLKQNIIQSFILQNQKLLESSLNNFINNQKKYDLSNFLSDNLNITYVILDNYNEDMFSLLVNKLKLNYDESFEDNNIHEDDKIKYSLIQWAIYLKKHEIIPSLIKIGYKLNDDDIHKYGEHYNEIDFLKLIKLDIINQNTTIGIEQKKNIFFHFLEMEFFDTFNFLYNYTKNKNPEFIISNFEHHNTKIFIYYLNLFCEDNDYDYPELLNIFLDEGFNFGDIYKNDIIKALKIMKTRNINSFTYFVSALRNIFNDFEKKKNINNRLIEQSETITWLNPVKLENNYLNIKEKNEKFNLLRKIFTKKLYIKNKLSITNEEIFDDLKANFPNFNEVIDYYQSQFRLNSLTDKNRITPILLLGEPGIGKTFFAQELAKKLNTGYTFIDIASCSASWIITGSSGAWNSAKQGKILDAMLEGNTISPIILLDEIEKTNTGKTYDPTTTLYQLLEEVNAKKFTDEFLDMEFDASNIIYIACANTFGTLSEPLISRFKTFQIKKPTPEQFEKIIYQIYNSITDNSPVFSSILNQEIISILTSFNIREAKNILEEAIGNALLETNLKSLEKQSIVIEKRHIFQSKAKKSFGF